MVHDFGIENLPKCRHEGGFHLLENGDLICRRCDTLFDPMTADRRRVKALWTLLSKHATDLRRQNAEMAEQGLRLIERLEKSSESYGKLRNQLLVMAVLWFGMALVNIITVFL